MRTYSTPIPSRAVSTAITLLQVIAGTNNGIRLIGGYIQQNPISTPNQQQRIRLLRKTVAATMTNAIVPVPFSPSDSASFATAGDTASAEGTNGVVLLDDSFSVLTGWWWKPREEEFVEVKGGGIIALVFPAAPGAGFSWTGELVYQEFG
jgi:hypothetical protein